MHPNHQCQIIGIMLNLLLFKDLAVTETGHNDIKTPA